MTIIVKNEEGKIIVMCKGADSIISPRLHPSCSAHLEKTLAFLDAYARDGLRTLLLAFKEIHEDEYNRWNEEY